jgi:hypothetical protein
VERISEKGAPSGPRTVKAGFRIIRRESTGFRGVDGGDDGPGAAGPET